ncbi:hypothetical protein ACEPAH_7336 [Sanghuangporus vaninii]
MFHLTPENVPSDLLAFMHKEFADEVDRGDTYPYEPGTGTRLSRQVFEGYFLVADALVGIRIDHSTLPELLPGIDATSLSEAEALEILDSITLESVTNSRSWKDCIAGFYYVKPNYPGRSSHICNAGFVVPFNARGQGFARVLAQSYVYYAPRLGYQASVFNLVYCNNVASIRLWEALGFSKAGRIPRAGRLKRKNGRGEEFVDAWIFYKSFISETPAEDDGPTRQK